jgi:PAS domain-containing protein
VPVAREMVVDSMEDGVIVLDAERRLVDLNAAAERYTGCTAASLGRPIDEVVAWWTGAVDEDRPLAEGQPALVKVEPGPRYFEVKVSAVSDAKRRFVGWLVIVHDVPTGAATKRNVIRSSGACRNSSRAKA